MIEVFEDTPHSRVSRLSDTVIRVDDQHTFRICGTPAERLTLPQALRAAINTPGI
jgi:hypothetical protein